MTPIGKKVYMWIIKGRILLFLFFNKNFKEMVFQKNCPIYNSNNTFYYRRFLILKYYQTGGYTFFNGSVEILEEFLASLKLLKVTLTK